ncbi:MAG TPA: hypothetical protein VHD90_08080 [Phototrophicaceae bacterium]|nr:hypothetical protein [Phototrophicaceae bacterium]
MADWSGGGWEIYKGDTLLGTAYFRHRSAFLRLRLQTNAHL